MISKVLKKLYGYQGHFNFLNMGKSNAAYILWFDIRIFHTWYVVSWRKNSRPYMYASNDATPPDEDNRGYWIFGRLYYQ